MKHNSQNSTRLTKLPLLALLAAGLCLGSSAQAATYTWDPINVTNTPTPILDWFTGGANPLGLWTGPVVPVSASDTTIRFFADTTTFLPNTAVPSTQTNNLNNSGSAFQLGTLTLNGIGSTNSGASLTMTLQGDALNFSAATGTINFNSLKNVAPANDTVVNYTINNNIQLGTAGSASALTLTGNGDSAGSTTYNIGGTITELQAGGGSLLKSGSSIVTINGALSITGGVTNSAGQLNLPNNTNTASSMIVNGGTLNVTGSTNSATTMTVNGGTLILTGNLNPASGSMTVNTGGILRIGNNTATQFGPSGNYSGNISTGTGGTLQLWSTAAQTLSGVISGSGGIHKSYGGALTLSNSNTYTGKTQIIPQTTAAVSQNVATFNSVFTDVGLGTVHSASSTFGAPTTVANGTIDLNGQAQASVTLNYVSTATGETTDRVLNLGWNSSSAITLTAANTTGVLRFTSAFTSTANSGHSGSLTLRGAGLGQIDQGLPQLGTAGLIKNDAGTWTLGGSGSFTGQTLITAGTLSLTSATALRDSPFSTASVVGGAAAGLKIATTTLTLGGLTGANALRGRFTTALGGPSNATVQGGYDGLTALTLNTVAGSASVYTGAIVEGATGMTLTKTGAGFQTLGLGNTYTGTTFVNGGFLQLNGNTLAGGLSVSNAQFAGNSTFAGVASVTSGGVISPGASSGAIGTLTINNASASALTLDGSTAIFDLPSTVTTPDQIVVTGGLVINGINTLLLRTPTNGTPAGVYNLITAGSSSGAGSFVLANGSATMGNATVSVSGGNVILTVIGTGLAGTTTYTGAGTAFNAEGWNVSGNWNNGIPTGATNVALAPSGTQNVVSFGATTPTFTGDLWINNGVTLQVGSTTGGAAFNNVLGTPGSTIIYMGQNSAISSRNSGFNPTMPAITLLGDASMRFQESTQVKVDPNFAHSISGPFTLTLSSGNGNGFSTHTLNAANSFAGLNLAGAAGVVNADVSGSIGTANLTISGGGTVNLNHATAISDGTNPIRINNGTLTYGTTSAAPLTLGTRPIELNGSGQATINNNNIASSSANILTLNINISSTAAGAKTLTLGGANVGLNLVSTNITDGTGGGTVALAKNGVGTWQLSGNNSYGGATVVSAGNLILSGNNTTTGQTTISGNTGATLTLSGTNSGMSGNVVLSTSTPSTGGTAPRLNINSATALGTGILNFGGGAATDVVRIDNTSAGAVNVSTTNAITMNRDFTFVGTQDLNLGTGATTLGGLAINVNRIITVTANTLTLGGTIAEATPANNNGITKAGAGTLVLSNANTYSGLTTVSGGTLVVGTNAPSAAAGALGSASSEVSLGVASGSVNASILIGGAFDVGRNIRIATANTTDAGTRVLTLGGNTADNSIFSGNIFLGTASQAGRGVTLTAASGGQVTFSGMIQNPGSMDATTYTVTKSGLGTVVLANTNTYSGATTVTNGTLLVNGNSAAVTNVVTVATNATFGGTNIIGSVVRYQNGSLAQFTVNSPMTFTNAAFLTNVTVKVDLGTALGNGTYVLATNYVGFTNSGSLTFATNSGTLAAGRSGSVSVVGNNLVLTVISANTAPVAFAKTFSVAQGGAVTIAITNGAKILATDADGDPLTFVSFGDTNAVDFGTAVTNSPATTFTYTNTNGVAGTNDMFSFIVTDGVAFATNTITIQIDSAVGANLVSATHSNSVAYLVYSGIPGTNYVSQRTTNLAPPITWTSVATNTAGAIAGPTPGMIFFTNTIVLPTSFFRTQAQ